MAFADDEVSEVDTLGRTSSGIFGESASIGDRGEDIDLSAPSLVSPGEESVGNIVSSHLNASEGASVGVGIGTSATSTSTSTAENIEAEPSQASNYMSGN